MGSLCRALFILVLVFVGVRPVSAELGCQTELHLNESNAQVTVDGKTQKVTIPMFIQCKNKAQTVRVVSSDNQEFVRVIPAAKDFTASDRSWNLVFLPQNSTNAHAAVVSSHAQLQDSYQAQILSELTQIRKLFESLVTTHPKLKPMVESKVAAAARAVSSLGGGPVSVVNYAGFYVQLHSLMRKNFDPQAVKNEMGKIKPEVAGSALKFCKWRHREDSPLWTRVVVGPFSSVQDANEVVKLIGRDTFTVRKLNCYEQEMKEVEI